MKQELANAFAGASVLVPGGAGFVGGNLVRDLLAAGPVRIHVVDNLLSSERANVPNDPRVLFTEGSIADRDILSSLSDDYDYVFHLSTYHGNQSSIHDPLADHENNLLTTLNLFERIKGFRRLRKVVYAASGCAVAEKTFDQPRATQENDSIPLRMDSPYAISKAAGEMYAIYYHARHGVPTVRARFQNVYGPGEILGAGRWRGTPATVWRNVTPTFVYKALKRESLPVEGTGTSTRDFIYVGDIVEGLSCCALRGAPGDVYNLAVGRETSILDLANVVNELTGNPSPHRILPRRDWDHHGRRFADTTKAARELGFTARVELRDGLARLIDWTRENLTMIDTCIHKHDGPLKALGA
jgi:UDP-glucose 4-epimerase